MSTKKKPDSAATFRKDLEKMVWSYKHRDYKSVIDGKRYVTIYRTGIGTSLEPLSSISDADLISLLSSSSQRDFEARKPKAAHMTKRSSNEGRTLSAAAAAGDSFQVETLDGKHHLYMPGSRGVQQTLRNVRKHWKHRLGQRVRVYRVLPGSRTGAMMLQEHSEATL